MKNTSTAALARQLAKKAKESDKQKYVLRLYVAGITPKSTEAIQNITQICDENLKGR